MLEIARTKCFKMSDLNSVVEHMITTYNSLVVCYLYIFRYDDRFLYSY